MRLHPWSVLAPSDLKDCNVEVCVCTGKMCVCHCYRKGLNGWHVCLAQEALTMCACVSIWCVCVCVCVWNTRMLLCLHALLLIESGCELISIVAGLILVLCWCLISCKSLFYLSCSLSLSSPLVLPLSSSGSLSPCSLLRNTLIQCESNWLSQI